MKLLLSSDVLMSGTLLSYRTIRGRKLEPTLFSNYNKEVKPPEAEIFSSLKSPTPIEIHNSSREKCITNNKKCSKFPSPAGISTKRSIKALIHDNRAAGAKKIWLYLGSKWYPIPPRGVGGCPENIPENDLGNTKHSGKYPYGRPPIFVIFLRIM